MRIISIIINIVAGAVNAIRIVRDRLLVWDNLLVREILLVRILSIYHLI